MRKRETYGSLKRMVLAKIERNGNSAERGEKKIGEKRKKVRKEKCEKNNI